MADFRHQVIIQGRDQASGALRAVGETTQSLRRRVADLTTTFAHSLTIMRSITHAARAVGAAMVLPITLAGQQEQATVRLNAALRQQGVVSQETSAALLKNASVLERVTRFGGDAILEVEALLLQFGRLSTDQVPRATAAVLDLAEANGQDLTAAAQLVAKSVGSTSNALSRYGVQIDNALRGSERFDAIMEQLEERVGGTAQILGGTFLGQIEQTKNAWGNLLAELGGFIVRDPVVRDSLSAITDLLGELSTEIKSSGTQINALGGNAVRVARDAIPVLIDAVAYMVETLSGKTGLSSTVKGIITVFDALYSSIQGTADVLSGLTLSFIALSRVVQGEFVPAQAIFEQATELITGAGSRLEDFAQRAQARFAALGDETGSLGARLRELADQLRAVAAGGADSMRLTPAGEVLVTATAPEQRETGRDLAATIMEGFASQLESEAALLEQQWEELWTGFQESGERITGAAMDSISASMVEHSTTWKEQFTEFGESVKATLLESFLDPILGAESALAGLTGALLEPFRVVGEQINELLFEPLVDGLLRFLGVKAALEEADLKRQQANAVRAVAATMTPAATALAAMMPGLGAAAAASLVATFGASALAAAQLPGILASGAAEGAIAAATLAGVAAAAGGGASFAEGGRVTRRTFAEIGEAGPEMIIPESRPGRARLLLEDLFRRQPGLFPAGGGMVNHISISVAGGTDPRRLADELVLEIDRRLGRLVR